MTPEALRMTHTLTLHAIEPVTHNVHRLRFDRPEGFDFQPGQAVLMALDRDGWRDDRHPFTMTSLPEADHLEFTIKSYPEHHGITEQIGRMQPGDRVRIGDAWGAITDSGPGVFIAGGAGVTPFIAILRRRARDEELDGCTLIFSNSREKDIILRREWEEMAGLRTVFTLTGEEAEGLHHGKIDGGFLDEVLNDYDHRFYICGPPRMVEDLQAILKTKNVPEHRITVEES
jgi:ferredoxin-NADP reductase